MTTKEDVRIMSEQQQQQAPKRKLSLQDLPTLLHVYLQLIHARNDPKAFEQVVKKLAQDNNVPPKDIPIVHNTFIAVREVAQAKQPSFVSLYLVGGMGAVDLILLQVLLSVGTSDTLLSVALFLLVLSLPLTAMSLFFSFLKQKYNIATYGKVHRFLISSALATGIGSLDGAIWHISPTGGIVFLFVAAVMYLWANVYLILIQTGLRFIELQKPPEVEAKEQK